MEFQTRTEGGELRQFPTLKGAFNYARENREVWKISFSLPTGERARFVRNLMDDITLGWLYEPIDSDTYVVNNDSN